MVVVVDVVAYRRRNRRRVLIIVGAMAALVIGGTIWSTRSPAPVCAVSAATLQTTGTTPPVLASGSAPSTKWAALVVDEGDTVTASGKVVAVPCNPVLMCASAAIGDLSTDPASCSFGIPVLGVNLHILTHRQVSHHVTTGEASLRGTWRHGVLTVASQSAPQTWRPAPQPSRPEPPLQPPCPPPPSGWLRHEDPQDLSSLHNYLQQHPQRYGEPWQSWPEGFPSPDSPLPEYRNRPMVVAIQVLAGTISDAKAELSQVYLGNLCVVAASDIARPPGRRLWPPPTPAVVDQLIRLQADSNNHIWVVGSDPETNEVTVELFMLDQRLHDILSQLDHDNITLYPWLRPTITVR